MVNVIGLGYIGLPTALMMASHGVEVVGTDYNKELVATLNAGKTTFKEDGLDELFNDAVKAGIKFTTEYQVTDTYIVSVPTPYDKFSKKVDAVYDSDPNVNPDAKKFDALSFSDILSKELGVMDSTAASMCRDNNMPILVFGLDDPENIVKAVTGEKIGTLVTKDGTR